MDLLDGISMFDQEWIIIVSKRRHQGKRKVPKKSTAIREVGVAKQASIGIKVNDISPHSSFI